jgi:hypothetical protein
MSLREYRKLEWNYYTLIDDEKYGHTIMGILALNLSYEQLINYYKNQLAPIERKKVRVLPKTPRDLL